MLHGVLFITHIYYYQLSFITHIQRYTYIILNKNNDDYSLVIMHI